MRDTGVSQRVSARHGSRTAKKIESGSGNVSDPFPTFRFMTSARVLEHRSSLDELADSIIATAGRLAAATCQWLLLVADFDARDGWQHFGMGCTSHWLAHTCSLAQRTAEEHVRVARALVTHPLLAQEMSAGRLSYSHVRAISRVARPGEDELVEELVHSAEHATVRQLESMVRGLRTVRDVAEEDGGRPAEYVKHSWCVTGQQRVAARLDPEHGALVESALASIARAEGLTLPEALVRLAEIGLAAVADRPDSADSPDQEPAPVARALRGDEEAAIVVHVDATKRSRERPLGRVANGPGLPDEVVERLMCVGRIRTVLRDGPEPTANVLDLGRSRRLVTRRQFRALLLRDQGCAHPGCRSRHGLEAHHVEHWIRGGRTDLTNLVLLCRRHHHAHHDGKFEIVPASRGRFRFLRRDGVELPERVDPSTHIPPGAPPIIDEHPDVAPDAATTRWDGERLQREWAISVLATLLNLPQQDPGRWSPFT